MYSLILLNGGVGKRAGLGQPKQFLNVNGIPILIYSLVAADECAEIDEIVLNYPPGWRSSVEELLKDYAIRTRCVLTKAGDTRQDSVNVCLRDVSNSNVLIHETARPLVTRVDFERLMADEHGNVSFMVPIPFTVALVDPDQHQVTGALDRSEASECATSSTISNR